MKHAREDYNRFQDPENKIPADEPVFLLRGQDKYADRAVNFYAKLVEKNNGSKEIVEVARKTAGWMREWPKHKEPDMVNA